jgi:putative DNA primase/helicase
MTTSSNEQEERSRFFRALLGDGLPPDQWAHVWHHTNKLSDWVQAEADAEASASRNGRHDVYMGLGLAGVRGAPGERVRNENAAGMFGVGADIDIFWPDHKETALPPDVETALAFIDSLELPPTFIVDSGHGLQPWWLLCEPWAFGEGEREEGQWLGYAWQAYVNARAKERGWEFDSVGDLARILRVPGTLNAKDKGQIVPVRFVRETGIRYTREQLAEYCGDTVVPVGVGNEAVTEAQRFIREHPCPICKGHRGLPKGTRTRCWGYLSRDGDTAFCTREEYAGGRLAIQTRIGFVYAHQLRPSAYAFNDTGNALRLLDAGGRDRLRYVPKRQFPWQLWDGNCWPLDREQRVGKWMGDVLHEAFDATWKNGQPRAAQNEEARWLLRSGDDHNIAGALSVASRHVSVLPEVFDTHPWLLPCKNGLTYDLRTGELRESRREDLLTRCAPVAASRVPVPHPKWDQMLDLVMNGDPEMVRYLRQCLGLLLTGDVSEKCFWFWVGETNRGKTTVLAVLAGLLGDFAYKIPLRAVLSRRNEMTIRHDLAGLRGIRLAYAEEFKPGDVLDVGIIKDITGGDRITADRKGEANETFPLTAKLIIGTNDLPELRDLDSAIRGRVRVLPFLVDIPAEMRTLGLPLRSVAEVVDDVLEEAPGILQDLVAAVREWLEADGKLRMPMGVIDATAVYLNSQDQLVEWMDACCVRDGTTERRPFAEWYWSFLVQSDRDEKGVSTQWFGRELARHAFVKHADYKGKYYTGPALKPEAAKLAENWAKQRGR